MTLKVLDCTTNLTKLADIKAAFVDAGIVATEHYYANDYYIVTTTMFSFVIKIQSYNTTNKRIYVRIGTAYDSGTNILNPININVRGYDDCAANAAVIITPDIIAIADRRGSNVYTTIFGKVSVAGKEIALGMMAPSSNDADLNCYNFTGGERVWVLSPQRELISAANKYYLINPIVASAGNKLIGEGIDGLSILARAVSGTTAYEVVGDDIAIQGGGSNQVSSLYPLSWLIKNGNV